MNYSIEGKVIVIAGTSGGLGEASAHPLTDL
jgi:NADP-dependent 3-hydroxy acid dehydrogenase YdfG